MKRPETTREDVVKVLVSPGQSSPLLAGTYRNHWQTTNSGAISFKLSSWNANPVQPCQTNEIHTTRTFIAAIGKSQRLKVAIDNPAAPGPGEK